jgi:type VI secretion system protein ImpK
MRAIGRGEAQPVAPNDTPANRALNRRVEITLVAGTQ